MKKKILFIQQNLQGGGAEKVLVDILNNFNYERFEVELVVIQQFGVYLRNIHPSVKVHFLMGENYPRFIAMLKAHGYQQPSRLYLSYKLHKALAGKRYDTIVSFMEGVSTVAHYMVRKAAKRNISWVHTDLIKNDWCKKSFKNAEESKRIYASMDEIVCVSSDARESFVKKYQIDKCRVIYNIIDAKYIREKSDAFKVERKDEPTVVTVGRLIPVKNQMFIIEAARILKSHGVKADFWILGEGSERSKLEQKIVQYKLDDRICLLGFKDNPYPYIKASDVFVLPSFSEGLPLVVCEAMCIGKPILSTRTTGPSELLNNGTGILCDISLDDFAEKLEKMITNKELLIQLSENSMERSKQFSVEETMNVIYSVLVQQM